MDLQILVVKAVKFIYSEKSYVVPVKSKVEISQNFVVFSEYMNFTFLYVNDFTRFFCSIFL